MIDAFSFSLAFELCSTLDSFLSLLVSASFGLLIVNFPDLLYLWRGRAIFVGFVCCHCDATTFLYFPSNCKV